MLYDQIKSIQIIVLTLILVTLEGPIKFISALLTLPIVLTLKDYYYINAISSITISVLALMQEISLSHLVLATSNLVLCYFLRGDR